MPMYDYSFLLQSDTANTTDAVTTNEVDFGVTTPAPNISNQFGMHVIVTTTFGNLTEGVIWWILHDGTGTLNTSSPKHTGMFVAAADMVKNAHHYVPCGSIPLLRYACGMFDAVNTAANAGKTTVYLGAFDASVTL
jgi:hypothetical protein